MSIPTPRTPKLSFENADRAWMGGSAAATNIANAVNLLFPAGERFFIRSVRHYMDRITPDLAAQVKGFFGQEGRHANAHEKLFDTLRDQGYAIDDILATYDRVAYGIIEKISPPATNLACTVALEHFTAIMAADALESNELEAAHPEMRRLFEWHALEELEHKAVAFDVLKQVNPSYPLRIFGVFFATTMLGGFWLWAYLRLLEQDGLTLRRALKDLAESDVANVKKKPLTAAEARMRQPIAKRVFARGILEYLRPGFHPNDRDDSALIAKTLARLGSEGVVSVAAAS